MEILEELGVGKTTRSFTIPMGATINMDGTAIMQGVAALFIAQIYGIELGVNSMITIVLTATLASIGTAGVPGVGMIMLSMVLTSVGLPLEGIGLIMGVERIIDMFRTTVNVMGDNIVTLIIANSEKDLNLDDSIKFDLMAGAFTSGDAEYVTLFEPTASLTEIQGKGYIVASVGEASGEVPYTAYCAKKSYIENNPKTIESITRAIYKGQVWVKAHSAREVAEKIQSYFPGTSVESIEKSVQAYKDIDAWNSTPVLKEEAFDKLQLIMTEAGELKQKAPYDKIVNNSFAEKDIK